MLSTLDMPPLVGQSPAFLQLMEQVSRIAALDRPALVVGERGTGKELVAAQLHYLSPRWQRPYVRVNAAALPKSLLESELFGHEAGAFTGAVRRRAGRFEQADGGTLLLDEIAEADLAVQEKLLRVVEYGQFERLGSSSSLAVDVRVIGATNRDLPAEAAAGRFRPDLLDRLSFYVLTIPPLRARGEDILLLTEHFAAAMAVELGGRFRGFAREVGEALLAHSWPGNVRELKNVVERAVSDGKPGRPITEIVFDPFASPWRPAAAPPVPEAEEEGDLPAALARYERRRLEAALERTRHNQREAARLLGLGYDQLRHRLRKHGLARR